MHNPHGTAWLNGTMTGMDMRFLTIGDVTNDAFIELQDASVSCDISSDACTITMSWGDKIPYKRVTVVPAVGNSANAAVSVSRLGIPVGFISFVGADQHGRDCIDALREESVDTTFITEEAGKSTNYHYVLSYDAERTILVRHEHFTYALPDDLPDTAEWLYLSSVGEAAESLHDDIVRWLDSRAAAGRPVKLVFQPGTFQMKMGYERLREIYGRTHLFVCNRQEAQRILGTKEGDCRELMREMHRSGPALVSITDGPNGAYAYDGSSVFFVPQYPDIAPPRERTGAGDAYTSTLASFLAKGFPLRESLLRAPINSMSVVQHVGAQKGLLPENDLERYLRDAPDEYRVTVL